MANNMFRIKVQISSFVYILLVIFLLSFLLIHGLFLFLYHFNLKDVVLGKKTGRGTQK